MSIQEAEQFEDNEQYEQAYEEYKKVYQHNPSDVDLLFKLAHIALILEKTQDAEQYYHEVLKYDITNTLAYEQLMEIYEKSDKYKYYIYRGNLNSLSGKLDFAINDFKKALTHADKPEQIAMTRLTLANLYRQTDKMLKAIDEYNILLEGKEVNEEMFLQLADIYLQDSAYQSAIETLLRAKKRGLDTDRINEGLATVCLKSGDVAKALEYTKDPLVQIQCMIELGKGDEAFEKLEQLPQELKTNPKYYTLKAQYYYSAKDFDKALECISQYDKIASGSPLTYQMRALVYDETNDKYNSYLNWGKYHLVRKDVDMAIHEFLNATQIKDDDTELLFELAQLLTENGEIDHASEYYQKIIKADPKNTEALKKLSQYWGNMGDYQMQTKYLEKAADSNPNDTDVLKSLAKGYEKIHQPSKAVSVYKKYLELVHDPNEIELTKSKLEKLETMGDSSSEESEGLIDKIMKIFSK